ncbi:MAG: hypothetical protein AB1813_13245 [Verrucomicrobiota bacterium]
MEQLAFWLPLILIFASALVAGIVKRYTKDPCLKRFQGDQVHVRLKDGRWISGCLRVYSNCLEVGLDPAPNEAAPFEKLSYVLYEHNLDSIDRILRPSPAEGTRERTIWERDIQKLLQPSLLHRLQRRIRNLFNMLRDAVAQSITILFGAVKKKTKLGTLPMDEGKVGEIGRSVISVVPNSYEPILERYLGRPVIVESPAPENKIHEQIGVLQEYSAKYILVRDVDHLADLPPLSRTGVVATAFDVVFPRPANTVRYLAQGKHKPLSLRKAA